MTHLGNITWTREMPCFKNTEDEPDKFDIGEWTYGLPEILGAQLLDKLTIGKFCAIGGNVRFLVKGHEHDPRAISTYPFLTQFPEWTGRRGEELGKLERREITIGHDVWIGQDAMIRSNVSIGHGAVIGIGAVVRKSVPPYHIVKGVDEQKARFSEDMINRLLHVAWWHWPNELISEAVPALRSNDIDALERMAP